MHWIPLTDPKQLDDIVTASQQGPVAIYKHSTRCSISRIVMKSLEQEWSFSAEALPIYYLDLLNYRPISNQVAAKFSVEHESPQLIVIKDGKAIYHASHEGINVDELKASI